MTNQEVKLLPPLLEQDREQDDELFYAIKLKRRTDAERADYFFKIYLEERAKNIELTKKNTTERKEI